MIRRLFKCFVIFSNNSEEHSYFFKQINNYPENVKYHGYVLGSMRLNPDQIKNLRNREDLTPQQKRDFDYTARSRLLSFLMFVPDANDIIKWLPWDHLKKNKKIQKILSESVIPELMELLKNLLSLAGYAPIQGTPDNAFVLVWNEKEPINLKIRGPPPSDLSPVASLKYSPVAVRPVDYQDIDRNLLVQNFVTDLSEFYQTNAELLQQFRKLRTQKVAHNTTGEETPK